MYRWTFERRIALEGGDLVSEFDVIAPRLAEAAHKAMQKIDQNLPSWLLKEDGVCLLGNLVKVVRIDASNRKETA